MHSSVTKSKLVIIDPVHNKGIRLATGAFVTSRFQGLYAESGETAIAFSVVLLKLAAQHLHPSHDSVFYPTIHRRYQLNVTAARPVVMHIQQLLQRLRIRLPQIIPNRLFRISPWQIIRPTCDLDSSDTQKA